MDLDRIHQILRRNPPPGVSSAYVDGFFGRNRTAMQRILSAAAPSGVTVDGMALDRAVRAVMLAAASETNAPAKAPNGMAFGLAIRGEAGVTEIAASNGEVAARVALPTSGDLKKSGLAGVCFSREQAENLLNRTGPVQLEVTSRRTLTLQNGKTTKRIPNLRDPLPGFQLMWPEFHQTGWTLVAERSALLDLVLAAAEAGEQSATPLVFHKTTLALAWSKKGQTFRLLAEDTEYPMAVTSFSAVKTKSQIGIGIPYLRAALESLTGPIVRLRQPGGKAALSKLSPIEITENTDDRTRPGWLVAPVRLESP